QLQENLARYVGSDNQIMREAYNRLRLQIGLVVRDLEEMRESGGGVLDVSSLNALRLVVDEDRKNNQEALGELIGQGTVTPTMGSSLINDSVFAHHISRDLIRAAQTLFATSESEVTEAGQQIELDESDLNEIARHSD
ncbi:MAG: hypothetical protein WBM71_14030, partial [Sedimenticolaceae bacterium]